MLEQF